MFSWLMRKLQNHFVKFDNKIVLVKKKNMVCDTYHVYMFNLDDKIIGGEENS